VRASWERALERVTGIWNQRIRAEKL
jgi:hypothetical protein